MQSIVSTELSLQNEVFQSFSILSNAHEYLHNIFFSSKYYVSKKDDRSTA